MHHSHLNVITALPQMHKAETNGPYGPIVCTNPTVVFFLSSLSLSPLSSFLSLLFTTTHTLANLCPAAMGVVLTAD